MYELHARTGCGCDSPVTGHPLMSVEAAIDRAHGLVGRLGRTELVALGDALGRILARDLRASHQMPSFDNSAMDGYAVQTCHFQGDGPWHLPVATLVAAGCSQAPEIAGSAVAVRIFTGAPVPFGFDAVVMQEYVEAEGLQVRFTQRPRAGQNVRRAGEDIARGMLLVAAGTRLEPRHVGLLAANGYNAINVLARPRIGIFSTGDELVEPGNELGPAQLFDANRALLISLARKSGAEVMDLGIVRDDLVTTVDFFEKHFGRHDLLVSSGAVSVGGKDFVKPAFELAGGTVDFWRVAMKPGKPVMFGRARDTVFAGLPGNSFAAYMGYRLFIEGMIARLQSLPVTGFEMESGIADFDWTRTTGRTEYFPVTFNGLDAQGNAKLVRLGHGGSASLCPLGQSDGIAVVAAKTAQVNQGDTLCWHRLM